MEEKLFIEYPKCSTCQKAKKWLNENNIKYIDRNIVTENPTKEELINWISQSKIDIKKFFNTSGIKYRELNLREKLDKMSYEDKINILATDGMLIKRPLVITKRYILIGFKENEWNQKLKEN